MGIMVDQDYGASEQQALAELRSEGFSAETKDYPPGRTEPHAHDYEVRLFILDGEFRLTDGDSGTVHACPPGARVRVSAGTRHSEDHSALRMVVGRR